MTNRHHSINSHAASESRDDIAQRITLKAVETPQEMRAVRALRVKVFVDEQGVPPEEEFDEHDSSAFHAMALLDGQIVGTGRLFSNKTGEAHVGRMAVDRQHRRLGIGGRVLAFLEEQAHQQKIGRISLHAQTYVSSFYARHGYAPQGEPFMEVDIEHVLMTKIL